MKNKERLRLLAELGTLNEMLSQTPGANVIDRKSIESRIAIVQSSLAELQEETRTPAKATLTFRGKPVVASHGILAEFATEAVNKFTDAVAGFAASLSGPLALTGPIPNRDKCQMLITGTARGSFGFELEQYSSELCLEEPSLVEEAMEQARALLQATLGSDDDLADSVTGANPRAVGALRDFLKMLADNEAICNLEFSDHSFRFSETAEVQRSFERLSQDNLHETEETLQGNFQGVLPKRRTFEFVVTPGDEVIVGKVGPTITDARVLNLLLYEQVKIRVQTTRVGTGRPRYVLLEHLTAD